MTYHKWFFRIGTFSAALISVGISFVGGVNRFYTAMPLESHQAVCQLAAREDWDALSPYTMGSGLEQLESSRDSGEHRGEPKLLSDEQLTSYIHSWLVVGVRQKDKEDTTYLYQYNRSLARWQLWHIEYDK